jgi:hypothetical protein
VCAKNRLRRRGRKQQNVIIDKILDDAPQSRFLNGKVSKVEEPGSWKQIARCKCKRRAIEEYRKTLAN